MGKAGHPFFYWMCSSEYRSPSRLADCLSLERQSGHDTIRALFFRVPISGMVISTVSPSCKAATSV